MFKKLPIKILFSIFLMAFLPTLTFALDLEIICLEGQKPLITKITDPLFQLTSFFPGDTEIREIYIANKDTKNPCRIYLEGKGSRTSLGDMIEVEVSDGVYTNTLSRFLTGNSVLIADLKPETGVTRYITLEFDSKANNSLSDQKMSFDINVISQWGADAQPVPSDEQVAGEQDVTAKKTVIQSIIPLLGTGGNEDITKSEQKNDTEKEVLGEEDNIGCKERTLWWIPILIQLFFTFLILSINKDIFEKKHIKLLLSILLGITSFFIIQKIGCGCNPVWMCEKHWIFNIIIAILPLLLYFERRKNFKQEYLDT